MAYKKVNDRSLTSVANAIRAKGGTSDALVFPDGFISAISAIQTGGSGDGAAPSAKWSDVTFIDYDGTVLYSYSLAEAQALTELPALPAHDGLVCQGWNWTLDAIKALSRPVTVGAMYITDDGATRLHIRIATVGRMTVPLFIGQTVENGVTIDWGDGSALETLAGTGNVNTSHTYAEPGDYVISLMPDDGCTLSLGKNEFTYCVMGSTSTTYLVYCNMLQDVSIGKNVTSIGNYTFSDCGSLASITIPEGVTSIGSRTFTYCYSLISITIPYGATSIDSSAFYHCYSIKSITIPDGVTSIGNNAFDSCYSIKSITIPDGVTSIDKRAFYDCSSLVSIIIPDGVTSINDEVFYCCYSLTSITVPGSVTSIGSNAFNSCCSLVSIIIPYSVTSIGSNAFNSCYSLTSITIPDGVTSIGSSAFRSCFSLASITIPNSVTSIGAYAFTYCYSLVSITIPNSVISIGNYIFQNCPSLASITISNSITSIGESAFDSCYSLASITIPDGVTSISKNAFIGCYGMRYYDFSACTAVPTLLAATAFKNIPSDCQMLIPAALFDAWSTATNWTTYAKYMVAV